jgi:amidase
VTGPEEPWEQYRRAGLFTPYTPLVNVTGQPAASVPWSVVDGLPAGIQLIGPPAGEAMLLRLSAQLEEAYAWAGRHPKEVWAG